ncbi:MAG TPA: V-type ATP synthase subunit E [Spirochaetia bacterium]|nr:V-type ATP synthase subunit E [Spirochaetia bacterium]
MEIQLNELLEKIKTEGIQNADEQAKRIAAEAEASATSMIEQARKEAGRIVSDAQQTASRSEQAGKDALSQAARDVILNVQERLKALFESVVDNSVRAAYHEETLQSAIVAVVTSVLGREHADLSVHVSPKELDAVEKGLRDRLAKELEQGLTIVSAPTLAGGFRLAKKEGGAYYDFSSESIAEILSVYVTPRLADSLKRAARTE